jgi:hypothetical protein
MSAVRTLSDLAATALTFFKIGLGSTAVRLKNASAILRIRNAADSADLPIVASKVSASGDDMELNEDAAASGADWKMTLRRPSSGMSEARVFVFPAGNPSVGQELYVASYSGGVATLDYRTGTGGADQPATDTTTLAFGDSSPVALFTKQANALVKLITVIIDTPFNGTAPTLSIGIVGTTSKYAATSQIDLTAAAGSVFEIAPEVAATVGTEALIATYAPDSSSAGSARILIDTVVPS